MIGLDMTSPEYAITMLMSRSKVPWNIRLGAEERISIELADAMRKHVASGRYRGVWFHVANEGKRHQITALIQKAMGMIPGVSDFVFIWNGGAAFIELKAGKKTQTDSQKFFARWCSSSRLTYAVCRSVSEAEDLLRTLWAFA
jgi:hypothetical protein